MSFLAPCLLSMTKGFEKQLIHSLACGCQEMGTLVHERGQSVLLKPEADGTQPRDRFQRADHLTKRTPTHNTQRVNRRTTANRIKPTSHSNLPRNTHHAGTRAIDKKK